MMMSGELEYEDIFYNNCTDSQIHYPFTAHGMFLIFVLLVTVILTNLLVGLAVSDIQVCILFKTIVSNQFLPIYRGSEKHRVWAVIGQPSCRKVWSAKVLRFIADYSECTRRSRDQDAKTECINTVKKYSLIMTSHTAFRFTSEFCFFSGSTRKRRLGSVSPPNAARSPPREYAIQLVANVCTKAIARGAEMGCIADGFTHAYAECAPK